MRIALLLLLGTLLAVGVVSESYDCDVTIVGGGPGGVYSAWRLASSRKYKGVSICVFEKSKRAGGRVWSLRGMGKKGDLVVDIGAYRFRPTDQPLATSLIQNAFKLPAVEYEVGDKDHFKTVDDGSDRTSNSGFVTIVETLVSRALKSGVKFYHEHEAKVIEKVEDNYIVSFGNGKVVKSKRIILNVPMKPFMRLAQNSFMAKEYAWPRQLNEPFQVMAMKLYVYYDYAWWVDLGLDPGVFEDPGQFTEAPLFGRYHDGNYKCEESGKNSTCYGYLLTSYTWEMDYKNYDSGVGYDGNITRGESVRYFQDFRHPFDEDTPYIVLDTTKNMAHKYLLEDVHKRLISYHDRAGIPIPASVEQPTHAVLVLWDYSVSGIGAGWHEFKLGGPRIDVVPPVSVNPWPEEDIYVANEWNSPVQGWMEGSLVMAENMLHHYFGMSKPQWITRKNYKNTIFDRNSLSDLKALDENLRDRTKATQG